MKFENSCVIAAPRQRLWELLSDIPKVAECLPGVEDVHILPDGTYTGIQVIKVGIIKLKMAGKISIDVMDAATYSAAMSVQANDHRISGIIQGKLSMRLEPLTDSETKLIVGTDINLMGKIGEFGGPIIKMKADQMMAEFAKNVASRVESAPSGQ